MTLTEFLLTRIAEDEAEAQDWPTDGRWGRVSSELMWMDPHGHPIYAPRDRVLAEVEAKRRIVELHDSTHECDGLNLVADPDVEDWSGGYGGPCYTLTALASIYAGHPDFREEWKSPPLT